MCEDREMMTNPASMFNEVFLLVLTVLCGAAAGVMNMRGETYNSMIMVFGVFFFGSLYVYVSHGKKQ